MNKYHDSFLSIAITAHSGITGYGGLQGPPNWEDLCIDVPRIPYTPQDVLEDVKLSGLTKSQCAEVLNIRYRPEKESYPNVVHQLYDEYLTVLFCDLEELPLHVNDRCFAARTIAHTRLELGV